MFIDELVSLGLDSKDCELLSVYKLCLSLESLIEARVDVDGKEKDIYHLYSISDVTKMFLRVIVGIGRHSYLDESHIMAVFYAFEDYKLMDACVNDMDKFNAIMRKFWAHPMSKPMRNQLLEDIKSDPNSNLVKSIELFGFKFHYTRANKVAKELLDEAKIQYRSTAECKRTKERIRRMEARLRVQHTQQQLMEGDVTNFKYGYGVGKDDGYVEGLVSDSDAPPQTPPNTFGNFPTMPLYSDDVNVFYYSGYKSGWKEGWMRGWLDGRNDEQTPSLKSLFQAKRKLDF